MSLLNKNDEVITTPTQLEYNGSTVYYYCGEFNSMCITEDNSVFVWGSNVYNIHLNKLKSTYKPAQINLLTYIEKR